MRVVKKSAWLVFGLVSVVIWVGLWIGTSVVVESPVSILPSTVLLVGEYGQGSGFAIEPNLIATAGHCVDIETKYVEAFDGTWHPVSESWRDNRYDVGFLRVAGKFPVIPLGSDPGVLDDVYLLSCMYGDVYIHSVTRGWVSYFGRNLNRWSGVVQVDVVGAPGSSGGVLIDKNLKVVGICVARDTTISGIVFFEPVSHILEAYEEYNNVTHEIEESGQKEVSIRRGQTGCVCSEQEKEE